MIDKPMIFGDLKIINEGRLDCYAYYTPKIKMGFKLQWSLLMRFVKRLTKENKLKFDVIKETKLNKLTAIKILEVEKHPSFMYITTNHNGDNYFYYSRVSMNWSQVEWFFTNFDKYLNENIMVMV